jgi:hypothetical protein
VGLIQFYSAVVPVIPVIRCYRYADIFSRPLSSVETKLISPGSNTQPELLNNGSYEVASDQPTAAALGAPLVYNVHAAQPICAIGQGIQNIGTQVPLDGAQNASENLVLEQSSTEHYGEFAASRNGSLRAPLSPDEMREKDDLNSTAISSALVRDKPGSNSSNSTLYYVGNVPPFLTITPSTT